MTNIESLALEHAVKSGFLCLADSIFTGPAQAKRVINKLVAMRYLTEFSTAYGPNWQPSVFALDYVTYGIEV